MSALLEYRGYLGSIKYSDNDELFHGRLAFIRDRVSYEGSDAKGLKHAFEEAVDDYLAFGSAEGLNPDAPLPPSDSHPLTGR